MTDRAPERDRPRAYCEQCQHRHPPGEHAVFESDAELDAFQASLRGDDTRERELSAVRLDLISALGQAQEHQERANTAYDALREIADLLPTLLPHSPHTRDAIAAIVANGPLDTAPGGPREDECARLIAERDQYRDALADLLEGAEDMRTYVDRYFAEKWKHDDYLARARAALSREQKDEPVKPALTRWERKQLDAMEHDHKAGPA